MKQQSQYVVGQLVKDILMNFKEELNVKRLMKYRPQFNRQFAIRMANQSMNSIQMQHTSLKNKKQLSEDSFPSTIQIDQFANYLVKSDTTVDEKSIVNHQTTDVQVSRVSTNRASSLSRRSKQSSQKVRPQKYFIMPKFDKNDAVQLPKEKMTEEELQFELQLRAMQKRLYYTRKMKKQFEEEDRKRLLALKRRKSPEVPKTDYTFGFDGQILKKKGKITRQLDVSEMKVSQSFNEMPKEKKNLYGKDDDDESQYPEQSMNALFKKTSLFNNYNKRQTSHLPYIKMTDNAKIQQSNRSSQGSFNQKMSLRNFIQTNQNNSFKHYNQIAKQKRDRELQEKLKLQSSERYDDLENSEVQVSEESPVRRRHSYLMNRYLKKMKEQYVSEQPTRRSVNFNRANFPQNQSIHKFYKHNFNDDKKSYQTQLVTNVLDG